MDQIQQAVEVASGSSSSDPALNQQALDFIQQFKTSDDAWKDCTTLLESHSSLSANMNFFIFQVLAEKVPFMSDEDSLILKDAMFNYLRDIMSKAIHEPSFMRNAVAKVFGLLFVHCSLTCYQRTLKDLLALATQDGTTFNEIATDYYLKTLVIVHQEIGDRLISRDKATDDRTVLLKDFFRQNDMVDMTTACKQILTNVTQSDIIDGALLAVGSFSSWIEINLILDETYHQLFYRCLTSPDEKIQIRTTTTLTEIIHKKMPPPKKLELLSFLNLGSFLNQMDFQVKDLDFSFAQALAKLCEQLGSECIEVLDRSSHDELKVNQFRNTATSKVLEIMPLIFKFLENEYDDISLEVFPFLANYLLFLKKNIVNEDIDLSALNNDQMLTTLLKKIILKMRYDQDDDGTDDETIEMFSEVRQKLSSFQDSVVIINEMLSLDVMIESINEFLFQHLNGQDKKPVDWHDIELGLYQLTYYSEMLRNNVMNLPKTMVNASRPYYVFNEMLCKVIDNSTQILLSHPLIQLLFFELVMKHYSFFINNHIQVEGVNKADILLKVLKIFVSNFGVFSDNPKVKFRSWYLFYRFIKMAHPNVDDYVIGEIVQGLAPIFSTDLQITGNGNTDLCNIDLTLVEETGSFENQLYLLETIGILVTLLHDKEARISMLQGVLQPFFSVLETGISNTNLDLTSLLQSHHALVSIGTIMKGLENLPVDDYDDKFVALLEQVSQVVLISLEQLGDYNVIREACSFCMIRLFILLSKLGATHGQSLQGVLSKFVSITMNNFDKLKIVEVINFSNFVGQMLHYCGSINPIYELLSSLWSPFIDKLVTRVEFESSQANDESAKRELLDLQRSVVSMLITPSSDHLNSLWLSTPKNKETLESTIKMLLNYAYNYTTNDVTLVKGALGTLIALTEGLGTGKVIDPADNYKTDAVFENVNELLVGNSLQICLELTFKLAHKELLQDAQFRNGVITDVARLFKTIAYIGYPIPDPNRKGKHGATNTTGAYNDATCQQIRDALVQLGLPLASATEFVQHVLSENDRQLSKYISKVVS